jgi:hypothetical protein
VLNATETYLDSLIAGDTAALLAGFAGAPEIDDPTAGWVCGEANLKRFVAERRVWLTEREARVEPVRTTVADGRTVFEAFLHLQLPEGREYPLPVGVVGVDADGGKLSAIRVYHSFWPLENGHRGRRAILQRDPAPHLSDVIAVYQRAIATGNIDGAVATFECDGYFREPAGGEYFYQGTERLRHFMTILLTGGGVPLEHCTVTDDGVAAAIEFNVVKLGPHVVVPQAGLVVYERGASGKLSAARVYDDVNTAGMFTTIDSPDESLG